MPQARISQDWPLKSGAFFAPFHPVGQSPTLAYAYNLHRAGAPAKFGCDQARNARAAASQTRGLTRISTSPPGFSRRTTAGSTSVS